MFEFLRDVVQTVGANPARAVALGFLIWLVVFWYLVWRR